MFCQDKIGKIILNWIKSIPIFKKNIKINLSATFNLKTDFSVKLEVWAQKNITDNVYDRTNKIEQNHQYLRNEIKGIYDLVEINKNNANNIMNEQKNTNENQFSEIKKTLFSLATGGLRLAALGAYFMFIGTVYSTLSAELARFL